MVTITNHVIDTYTDEGEGAIKLEKLFNDYFSLNSDVDGRVDIFPSVVAFGQTGNVKDVDLFMICEFTNYTIGELSDGNDAVIKNFACTFELKKHPFRYIERRQSSIWVKYPGEIHNASDQSRKEKFALRNYLVNKLSICPYIYDYVWLTSLGTDSVDILDAGDGLNILSSSFTVEDLFRKSIGQKIYRENASGRYIVKSWDYRMYDEVVEVLSTHVELPEGLTLRKINDLVASDVDNSEDYNNIGNGLTVLSGRAGTGKTFSLLRYALAISREKRGRSLILTYNKALVSDIRRLATFMHIPSGCEINSIQILTMDQFFFMLCKEAGIIEGEISPEDFNEGYNYRLSSILDNFDRIEDRHWKYVFIDEGQDWSILQRDIIFRYFSPKNVIVADGVDQFIMSGVKMDWQDGLESYNSTTKTICLRQKNNLVSFVRDYCNLRGLDWEIEANNNLHGGEVFIIEGGYTNSMHRRILDNCLHDQCEPYDVLFLVPENGVDKSDPDNPHFVLYDQFYDDGILLYDGTNPSVRSGYPIADGTCRLFEYESCRGLEGWAVICMNFDDLIESKRRHYVDVDDCGLALTSAYQRKENYVNLWSLMPLTRAVDTLVITIKNPNSDTAAVFRQLAERHTGYVHYIQQ